uniref:Uncharacterized protein n=1 Tax=Branchiostoma floridae TaxID=7739 RepID=C3ZVD4_BRAFL|eukprot:XP_002587444.1 hypothetical protein BRAFLDRAFT_100126 [Branchiostoma floridae]
MEELVNLFNVGHRKANGRKVCKGVCKSKDNRTAPEIPGGGNLALSETDRVTLQELVDYRLHPEAVKRQRKTMNTNRAEAFHNRVLKAVPKSMTFKRNYAGRVHVAGLAHSLGSAAAINFVNEYQGASHPHGSPGLAALEAIDEEEAYQRKRKQSIKYKGGVHIPGATYYLGGRKLHLPRRQFDQSTID